MDAERRENHRCRAKHCVSRCEPEKLMCIRHWMMVPWKLQQDVLKNYRPGQCEDMSPSAQWFAAANAAIRYVLDAETAKFSSSGKKQPLFALTIKQPWATLIAEGLKDVENREWAPFPSLIGKRIAIHAGKSVDMQSWGAALELVERGGILDKVSLLQGFKGYGGAEVAAGKYKAGRALNQHCKMLPHGGIIAIATLSGCQSEEQCKSPWFMGPIAWTLSSAIKIQPIACPGSQGLWKVEGELLEQVREAYAAASTSAETSLGLKAQR